MLLEFRVKNFRSFREEQVLSLVALGQDHSLPANFLPYGRLKVLKTAGVYGANAAGKSNLIRAMKTMQGIVLDSAKDRPSQPLAIAPFLFDTVSREEPTEFEVTFVKNEVRYQYGFSATHQKIVKEWLLAFPKGVAQTWFERGPEDWKFGSHLKGEKATLQDRTRENALFISVGAQWNHEQLTEVYKWFDSHLRVVTTDYPWPPVTEQMLLDTREHETQAQTFQRVLALLKKADLGIDDVSVERMTFEQIRKNLFDDDMPAELRSILAKMMEQHPPSAFAVTFHHGGQAEARGGLLALEEESDGTKRFFQLLGPFIAAVSQGFTVFFDELESHMHPLLTRELIKLFQSTGNKAGAQLVFATHDTTLLDPDLLRRDQIWFTEKSVAGATDLYSLAEYKDHNGNKPRKDEAMQKKYLSGKYGAIPILEAFSIDA